jgi:hypothetical protein
MVFNIFEKLSNDEIYQILINCDYEEIIAFCMTSKNAGKYLDDEIFWKAKTKLDLDISYNDFDLNRRIDQSYSQRYLQLLTDSGGVEIGSEKYEDIAELIRRSAYLNDLRLLNYFKNLFIFSLNNISNKIQYSLLYDPFNNEYDEPNLDSANKAFEYYTEYVIIGAAGGNNIDMFNNAIEDYQKIIGNHSDNNQKNNQNNYQIKYHKIITRALCETAYYGHIDMLKYLFDLLLQSDPNYTNSDLTKVLLCAVRGNNNNMNSSDIFDILYYDYNIIDLDEALVIAVQGNNLKMVQHILNIDKDLNLRDPLSYAAYNNNIEIVKYLLENYTMHDHDLAYARDLVNDNIELLDYIKSYMTNPDRIYRYQ